MASKLIQQRFAARRKQGLDALLDELNQPENAQDPRVDKDFINPNQQKGTEPPTSTTDIAPNLTRRTVAPEIPAVRHGSLDIHEDPRVLPPRDDMRRHLDEDVKEDVMQGVPEKQSRWKNPLLAFGNDPLAERLRHEQEQDGQGFAEDEAKAAFMQDPDIQMMAQEEVVSMEELWERERQEYLQNFFTPREL